MQLGVLLAAAAALIPGPAAAERTALFLGAADPRAFELDGIGVTIALGIASLTTIAVALSGTRGAVLRPLVATSAALNASALAVGSAHAWLWWVVATATGTWMLRASGAAAVARGLRFAWANGLALGIIAVAGVVSGLAEAGPATSSALGALPGPAAWLLLAGWVCVAGISPFRSGSVGSAARARWTDGRPLGPHVVVGSLLKRDPARRGAFARVVGRAGALDRRRGGRPRAHRPVPGAGTHRVARSLRQRSGVTQGPRPGRSRSLDPAVDRRRGRPAGGRRWRHCRTARAGFCHQGGRFRLRNRRGPTLARHALGNAGTLDRGERRAGDAGARGRVPRRDGRDGAVPGRCHARSPVDVPGGVLRDPGNACSVRTVGGPCGPIRERRRRIARADRAADRAGRHARPDARPGAATGPDRGPARTGSGGSAAARGSGDRFGVRPPYGGGIPAPGAYVLSGADGAGRSRCWPDARPAAA